MKNSLSVVIITKNEENNIKRCLQSVKWADEIVVVDTGSTDRTLEICEKYGCHIIETEWLGFGKTKQLGVNCAANDWILSIDADEEVTSELTEEIRQLLSKDNLKNGYRIKRTSFYLKKWIRYSGWNRDYPLRLFNRKYGNFNENFVHESVRIRGKIGKIDKVLRHYTYPNLTTYIQKIEHYANLRAEEAVKKGKRASVFNAIFHGLFKFLKMYLLNTGFLDGTVGLVLSINSAFSVYLKYLKIWERIENVKK
ncbi:MAG: glycosyltransferase family 2 protein [Candidatus Cloacimonadota bacterium]|nr:MAG: glycosyltransferase family 2 protein [Candidatus Cloacimonadota bacterium]